MQSLLYSLTTISLVQIFGIVIISLLSTEVIVNIAYCFRRFINKRLIKMAFLLIAIIALIFYIAITTVKSNNAREVLNLKIVTQ